MRGARGGPQTPSGEQALQEGRLLKIAADCRLAGCRKTHNLGHSSLAPGLSEWGREGGLGGEEVCQDDDGQSTIPTQTVIKERPLPLLNNSKHFVRM